MKYSATLLLSAVFLSAVVALPDVKLSEKSNSKSIKDGKSPQNTDSEAPKTQQDIFCPVMDKVHLPNCGRQPGTKPKISLKIGSGLKRSQCYPSSDGHGCVPPKL
ncbi:unnamed protein product [Chironomus riparius]|uniref:Uncharacterized protein n=1 Tax=Chironomus riparius TaxID=315576 RepID=A0A9N9S6R1_9DIPT|nr:unnamed protein product [Chironomus riparius]